MHSISLYTNTCSPPEVKQPSQKPVFKGRSAGSEELEFAARHYRSKRATMIGRFSQLFLLASVVLMLPTLFYLSRQQQPYSIAKDYALMQTQKTQGSGPPPAIDPQIAQSWKWNKPWDGWGDLITSATDKMKGKTANKAAKIQEKGVIMPKMDNATAK